MPLTSSILVYGRAPTLLETRRWVLERAGYMVSVSTRQDDVHAALRDNPPEVLILCHSLSQDECEQATHAASVMSPSTRQLRMATLPRTDQDGRNELVSVFDGPRALVEAVKSALSSRVA